MSLVLTQNIKSFVKISNPKSTCPTHLHLSFNKMFEKNGFIRKNRTESKNSSSKKYFPHKRFFHNKKNFLEKHLKKRIHLIWTNSFIRNKHKIIHCHITSKCSTLCLILSCIMLKNDQVYFKNLALYAPQDF